jgi:hypothetical protein
MLGVCVVDIGDPLVHLLGTAFGRDAGENHDVFVVRDDVVNVDLQSASRLLNEPALSKRMLLDREAHPRGCYGPPC